MANGSQWEFDARPKTMKKNIISYKMQELEQEVSELKKMLENEEKVHEVLERALLPKDGGIQFHISGVLPKKIKELLAELIMVEEEINRLENEISKINESSNKPKEVSIASSKEKPYRGVSRSIASLDELLMLPQNYTKVALETKPLFFINQAMKGEYMNGFTGIEKKENISCTINDKNSPKNSRNQDKNQGKSMEKITSPKPPRRSLQRTQEPEKEILFRFLKGPSPEDSHMKKDGQKLQPNKLSEKIMKCILCIFLRLIRTSRSSELEKSGCNTRTTFSSFNLKSNRGENVLNLSPSAVKEIGQQDPYGIFEIKGSIVRDIGPYKNLVVCTSSSFDVNNISKSHQLLTNLRGLLNNLREVDLQYLSYNQKLAFWINVYNICIMNGFLQHGMPTNPEKITALKNKAVVNIRGIKLNAQLIEDRILKLSSNKEWGKTDKEDVVQSLYGLQKSEPNIAFALCCGNKSSPSVKIYTVEGVSAELEKSKLEYLQASVVVASTKKIMIPKLLLWSMNELAEDTASLVEWICNQLPASGVLRKSITDCVKAHNYRELSDIVNIIPYDFNFQYLLPM